MPPNQLFVLFSKPKSIHLGFSSSIKTKRQASFKKSPKVDRRFNFRDGVVFGGSESSSEYLSFISLFSTKCFRIVLLECNEDPNYAT